MYRKQEGKRKETEPEAFAGLSNAENTKYDMLL